MANLNKLKKFNTFEDINAEYNYIRLKNQELYEKRKENIYKDNSSLKELDLKILKTFTDKCLAINNDEDTSVFDKRLAELNDQKLSYLKEHNIDIGYLEPIYTCDKCKDIGYVDGKKCSCYIRKEIELFDNISHFSKYIENDNFSNMNIDYYNQGIMAIGNKRMYFDYMKDAIKHMKEKINNIDSEPYNAIFVGPTGTGKTYLSRCIGAELIKKNKSVLYVNVNEYINSLKPDYEGVPLENYAIICDMFIIDDLGTENSTDFSLTKLNYIIDKRLSDNKSTIITTNLIGEELKDRYFNSMLSRIMHLYTKYMLSGEDLRRKKNANDK